MLSVFTFPGRRENLPGEYLLNDICKPQCWLMLLFCIFIPGMLHAQDLHKRLQHSEPGIPSLIIDDSVKNTGNETELHELILENPARALGFFSKNLHRSIRIGYRYGVVSSLMNIGVAYAFTGRYDHALVFFRKALQYNTSEGRAVVPSFIIHNTIVSAYRQSGDYERAISYYQQATGISYASSPVALASAYLNIASSLMDIGYTEQAAYYMKEAEKMARKTQNMRLMRSLLTIKGAFYGGRKEWGRSEIYFRKALDAARADGASEGLVVALYNMAALYLLQNMPERALPYLREAEPFIGKARLHHRLGLFIALGETWLQLGAYRKSEAILLQSLRLAEERNLYKDQADIQESISRLYVKTGNYQQAYMHLLQYVTINDSIAGKERRQTINRLEVKYRLSEKDKELALQQAQLQKKNFWIIIVSGGAVLLIVLIALLFSLYRNNLHKQNIQVKQINILKQQQELSAKEQDIELLKAMMSGEEKERNRIARELHDSVVGQLAAVRMHFNVVQRQHRELERSADFREALKQLDETAGEIRSTAHNLMPEILLERGLAEAVQVYCEKMGRSGSPNVDFQLYSQLPALDQDLELSIYRMIQELVQNIIKHANASQAIVQLGCHQNLLSITVEDNGLGFPEQVQPVAAGTGLKNIRSRIITLDGHFDIRSRKTGTTAYIEFDIRKLYKQPTA